MRITAVRPFRKCRFCLDLQDGCVFADFDVDEDGAAFIVMISFDGYGACRPPPDVGRMSLGDSRALLAMAEGERIDVDIAEPILRRYFRANAASMWDDALARHGLL